MKQRKFRRSCRIRHRWCRWAYLKIDDAPGQMPEVLPDMQFRMCRDCGHQEFREVICA